MVFVFSLSFYSLFKSLINFFISSFFGSNPNALKATFNSLTSIVPFYILLTFLLFLPEPSISNKSKASLISFFYLSVNSYLKA